VTSTTNATVCTTQLPYSWNNNSYTQAGTYSVRLTSQAGCDSIATLVLTVSQGTHTDTTASACSSFTWHGQTYTSSGVYNYFSQNGLCQDTVTLHLTIKQPSASSTTITICQSQLPYVWNGSSYTGGGTYTFITTNRAGCDSTATLILVVTQTVTGPTDSVTVCSNTLPYQWNGISITQAGTYHATLQSAAGCDSLATLVLATSPVATATVTGGNPICKGSSSSISIALTGSAPWTLTYSDGSATHTITNILSSPYVLNVNPVQTTTYSLLSVSDLKCSNNSLNSAVTITVFATQAGVRYTDVSTRANVPLQLQARNLGAGTTYLWAPPTGLNVTDSRTPIFNYDSSILYTITLTSANGCPTVDTLLVKISVPAPVIRSELQVPKAWSPNRDGHNDKLYPLTINILELKYFRIYNRWGQLMFETNQLDHGWDGIYKGKEQVEDVYTWTVEAIGKDGRYYKQSGNSILLR
jgi:gliding motility-associated-like protein